MISLQIPPSLFWDVLCLLHGMPQSLIATGNDSYDPCLGDAKGRRQLAGIQYAQTTARTCSDIEQSASMLHPWLYGFNQLIDLRYDLPDSFCHSSVFLIDMFQYFQDSHPFQMVET